MNQCSNCGIEYKLKFRDKLLRKQVHALGKLKGMDLDYVKDYCNDCWKGVAEVEALGLT